MGAILCSKLRSSFKRLYLTGKSLGVAPAALFLLYLACLATSSGCGHRQAVAASSPSSSATNIEISTKVKLAGVRRFGVNIGGQNFYDSGQMLRNLIFRNSGFEGESWRSILRCKTASAGSCADENQYAVWPQDFLKDAQFEFLSGPAEGLSGTIRSSSSASASNPERGVTFDFPPLTRSPVAGDFVLVSFDRPGDAAKGWWTDTLHTGSTFTTEASDLAPNTAGKQALRIDAAGAGQSARLDSYFDTYDGRSFLTLRGRFTLAFRAKGAGGSNLMTVSIKRAGEKGSDELLFPARFVHLTDQWKDYSYAWTASETGALTGHVDLNFTVSGTNALLDDVSLTAAAESTNPTVFRDEVVETLLNLKPGILRYNDTSTDAASTLDNLIAPPYARVRAGFSTQSTSQEQIPLGLGEVLALSKAVHAEPWYALPATITPKEAGKLIEYLAGPASSAYGAKRAALGQTTPWTQVFPIIHLEFGNELWNRDTFYGAAMSDPGAYGRRAAQIFAAARSSPFFNAARFDLVLGSQAVNPWWSSEELKNSSKYDSVAVAPYLFNKLVDTSSSEAIFGSMFAEPEMIDTLSSGYMAGQSRAARKAAQPARLEVYEANLGTDQGDAAREVVDSVVPSVGAGLAVVEHMLLMLRDLGVNAQSIYSLSGYANKFRNPGNSAEHTPLWGAVIDMGGPTNRRRPLYLAEQLANEAIGSTMLETRVDGANPTWRQPRSRNTDAASADVHILQAFAFADGGQRSLIVFNLDRQHARRITLSGDAAPGGAVTVRRITSAAITDSNEEKEVVLSTHSAIAKLDARTPCDLPPFSMTVFRWSSHP